MEKKKSFVSVKKGYPKRHTKGYMFTSKKHSDKAVMSVILGVISLFALGVVIFLSYRSSGDIPARYGFTVLLAGLFSLAGVILGGTTLADKDVFRFFPVLGVILNVLSLAGVILLFYIGW